MSISGARSDVGRVRRSNQDGGYAGSYLFVVADGMGGHAGGDVASSLATQAVTAVADELFESTDKAQHELVNAIIAPIIKVLALPLYILTFGLIALVINGSLLLLVAWFSNLIGDNAFTINGFTAEGLTIESLGWAILGGLVMSVSTFICRWVFRLAKIL